MQAWLESVAGPGFASALMWTVFALIGLLVLLVLMRIFRGLTFGTFVAGGRNRRARLAVVDATAVDSHRRLVLVRRDDTEHLLLIGGAADIVVERNVGMTPVVHEIEHPAVEPAPEAPRAQPSPARRPEPKPLPVQPVAAAVEPRRTAPEPVRAEPEPVPRPLPPQPTPREALNPFAVEPRPVEPEPRPRPAPPVEPSVAERPAERSAAVLHPQPGPATRAAQEHRFSSLGASLAAAGAAAASAPQAPEPVVEDRTETQPLEEKVIDPLAHMQTGRAPEGPSDDSGELDDALLQEIQATLEGDAAPDVEPPVEPSLDEEMSRLLAGISAPKR